MKTVQELIRDADSLNKFMASTHETQTHLISTIDDEYAQDVYLTLLMSVAETAGQFDETRNNPLAYVCKIAAELPVTPDMQEIFRRSLLIDEKILNDYSVTLKQHNLQNLLLFDALTMQILYAKDATQMSEYIAGLANIFGTGTNGLSEILLIVKAVINREKNFSHKFQHINCFEFVPYLLLNCKNLVVEAADVFLMDFETERDVKNDSLYPLTLSEIANIKKNRVIILNATHKSSSVLLLDDWKAKEILFLNCRFENCGGIYSTNTTVKFLSCSFDQEKFLRRYYKETGYSGIWLSIYYDWRNNQYKNYKELYHLENATFTNCIFKHFNDSTPFLYLGHGLIHSCTFEDIQQYPAPCTMFAVNNACISNSRFVSCRNSTDINNLDLLHFDSKKYTSCIIYSTNTIWKDNVFINCSNNFNLTHMNYYDIESYVLLLDKKSYCNDCFFDNVTTIIKRHHVSYSRDYWKDYAETSIIGLHESSANNNEGATVSNVDKIDFDAGW